MARSITTRSTNLKIMDDNIKILDDALAIASAPPAEDVSYDNTDSGLTATNAQEAIDELSDKTVSMDKIAELTSLTVEASNFSCAWQNYDILNFVMQRYGNAREGILVNKPYFEGTSSSGRIMLHDASGKIAGVWQNGNGSVSATISEVSDDYKVVIYGIKFS